MLEVVEYCGDEGPVSGSSFGHRFVHDAVADVHSNMIESQDLFHFKWGVLRVHSFGICVWIEKSREPFTMPQHCAKSIRDSQRKLALLLDPRSET